MSELAKPAARPITRAYGDIPVTNLTDWDVTSIKNALDLHERGTFYQSALLADHMLRDDRVASALNTRVLGLTGLPFELRPSPEAKNQKLAQKACDDLKECWDRICPESVVSEILRWGVVQGFGLNELVWTTEEKRWIPQVKVWHPFAAYYQLDTRKYVMSTMEGPIDLEPGGGKWFIHAPHGLYRGWMHGVVRSLAITFIARQFAFRDWVRYSEVHGLPIKVGQVPQGADPVDTQRFLSQLSNLSTESTMLLPKGSDGQQFDFDLKEANAGNWEAFERLILRCEAGITLGILSQNLTSEVQGGSFAAAFVHNEVRQDVKDADAKNLSGDLRRQVIAPWALYNYGDIDLAPVPFWNPKPPDDKAVDATTKSTLSTAISTLATALTAFAAIKGVGERIDVNAIMTSFGVPLRDDADANEPMQATEPPAPPPGMPGAAPAAGKPPNGKPQPQTVTAPPSSAATPGAPGKPSMPGMPAE